MNYRKIMQQHEALVKQKIEELHQENYEIAMEEIGVEII